MISDNEMMDMNYTEIFLNNINNFSKISIPRSVIEKAKLLFLDYLGVTILGACVNKNKINLFLKKSIDLEGDSPLIGLRYNVNIEKSLLINGMNSHVLDFDDGMNNGIVHIGSTIFTSLLPLAKKYNIEASKFWKAVVVGYEATFTLAASIQPMHKKLGFHATGTCGTIGSALAISYLLNYDDNEIRRSFSAAVLSASGSLKALEDISDLKQYNVGRAALNGYNSALLGACLFNGPKDVLNGDNGFLYQMCGIHDISFIAPLYNGKYAVEMTYIKPYAACRYCHPAIEAVLSIRNTQQIQIKDIKKINLYTYKLAIDKHDHKIIDGCTSAKMSIPYSIAVALVYGDVSINEFDENVINNVEIHNLMKCISIIEKKEFTDAFPNCTVALCQVFMLNGEVYEKQIDYPKGEINNPMTKKEVLKKFKLLTRNSGLDDEQVLEIINSVENFEGNNKLLFDSIGGINYGEK